MKTNIIAFTVGAAIGSLITWQLVKTKYEMIAQEEIESVKEVYRRKQEPEEKQSVVKPLQDKPPIKEYIKQVKKYNYADSENEEESEEEPEEKGPRPDDGEAFEYPYVITPEELGEAPGYDVISLIYFADDVLTDEDNELLDNEASIIGENWREDFGKYEDDTLQIRNDQLKTDYEILRDRRLYSNVIADGPVKG